MDAEKFSRWEYSHGWKNGMGALLSTNITVDEITPEDEENMFGSFLRNIMTPPNLSLYEGQAHVAASLNFASRDLLSFGLNSDLDLTVQDYNIIDFYQGKSVLQPHPPPKTFDGDASRFEPPTPQSDILQEKSPESIALGIEAFRQSLWCWTPSREDTSRMEDQDFSVRSEDLPRFTAGFNPETPVTSEVFGSDARDKIFAMILSICEDRSSFTRIVSSFPSADLLNNLMHCFLASHIQQSNTYIHVPTLKIATLRPVLLGAMLAAGAVLSSSLTIRKLGFAIQETVRLSLPNVCEENNSVTREIGLLQAFVLSLDVGLWSGNKRKIELAESLALGVVTMCRRASRMLRSSYTTVKPVESDTGSVLEKKWHAWAAEESFKRLVFQLFIRDAQTSIALIVPNIISYAELTLPLPSSKALFLAPTALDWKQIYLSTAAPSSSPPNDRVPCLAQCLHDLSPLNSINAKNTLDTDLCFTLVAYGIWGLILELSTLKSVLQVHPAPDQFHGSSSLVLGHRHQELCGLVQNLSMSLTPEPFQNERNTTTIQSHILASLLLTHLHVSFNDIQLFAGREGEEESRRVYPSLQAWVGSREARTAVWHAGQVIRYSKMLGSVREFFAVAVYHASLTFWAYGVLRLRGDAANSEREAEDAPLIWVDGEEGQEAKSFIALGRGVPCFSVQTGPNHVKSAKLSEPWNVMNTVVTVLRGRDKFANQANDKEEMPASQLVETLSQLIGELGAAAMAVIHN